MDNLGKGGTAAGWGLAFAAGSGILVGSGMLASHFYRQFQNRQVLANFDPGQIRDYSGKYQQPFARAPYAAHYKKGSKELAYIAANHENTGGLGNETFRTIDQAMAQHRPQLVILEGFETENGMSPGFMQKDVQQAIAGNFVNYSERPYAAMRAMENGVPFIGGEPPVKAVFDHMASLGYSAKDVMAFYLLRFIPIWREQGMVSEQNFDEYAHRYLQSQREFGHIPPNERLTVEEFKQWYAGHDITGKPYLDISTQNMAPIRGENASYFEKMQADVSIAREQHLDRLIRDALSKNDRVLVVYGSGHFVQSQPVFEKMFGGQAEYAKLGR